MTDTTLAPPADNGIVHVAGYGEMKLATARNLEAQARRRLDQNRKEHEANLAEIAGFEAEIAERRNRLRFLDLMIASDEKALGETPAPKGTAKRSRRSQGHTEGDGGAGS